MLFAGIDVIDPRTNNCRVALAAAHGCPSLEKLNEVYGFARPYDLLVHIDVSPSVAFDRVNERGRDSEDLDDLIRFHAALHKVTTSGALRIDGVAGHAEVFEQIQSSIEQLLH